MIFLLVLGLIALAIFRPDHLAPQSVPTGTARVFAAERLDLVHPALKELVMRWQRDGNFHVYVASGLRTESEQLELFAEGVTRAQTAIDTPHGRGGAVDIHPLGFDDSQCFKAQPWAQELMRQFGEWAEGQGAIWGGRFTGFYGPCHEVEGDWPHIEVKGWRSLPYPPPDYSAEVTAS